MPVTEKTEMQASEQTKQTEIDDHREEEDRACVPVVSASPVVHQDVRAVEDWLEHNGSSAV